MIQVRLIDADALRERIITRQTEMSYEDAWALTCVDNAPTVDARENVHGEWISICNGKQCNCSICGKGYDHTYEFIEEWNFCPNCGSYNGGDSDEVN